MSHVMDTYARLPVAFERGEGSWLWDASGKRYLDAMSGVAVCGLGHGHPKYVAALREQVGRLVHTSNLYRITLQEKLAERSEEHTSELQSRLHLVCRLLLEKKK